MKLKSILILTALWISALVSNAEIPHWLVTPSISPDGETIAFSYKGEIFTVPSTGGRAFQLTSNKAYDSNPVWTPDSKKIAFLSDREGSDDIFLIDAKGGTPVRLTTHSGHELPLTFLNDSVLLFNASLLPGEKTVRFPFLTQIYSINTYINNPRPKLYLSQPVISADANQEGYLLLQDKKGVEDNYRKHERSASTSDIWEYKDGKFLKLTDFDGSEQSPVWGEGNNYYFVSERDGTLNVYEGSTDSDNVTQITKFGKHPVRDLTVSNNGILAFLWEGDIYTVKKGEDPKKIHIEINADFYDGDMVKRYVNAGASEIAISPEGDEIAFIIRGELFVTDSKYKTTNRITNTPEQERTVSFSPDGRTLVFDSDTDGLWQLYTAYIKNKEEKNFAYATDIEIQPLYKGEKSAMQPVFSPDGKKVAFLQNRNDIMVIDIDTKKVTKVLDGEFNYSYEDGDIDFRWSPDSQWLLTTFMGKLGWNNIDIAAVKADGSEVINLTESGYNDHDPKWILDGKGVAYLTSRYGMKAHGSWGEQQDIAMMILDGDTWEQFNFTPEESELFEKGKKEAEESTGDTEKKKNKGEKQVFSPDFKNRKYRTKRLTGISTQITDFYLSPKGDKLYFIGGGTEGDNNLYVKNLKNGDTRILIRDIEGEFYTDNTAENVFLLTGEGIKKLHLADGDLENIEFEALYDRHPSLERKYIYDHISSQVEEKFYDKDMHGVDWKYYTEHYKEFLPYITNNRDFSVLLSELLGELNASHTGVTYSRSGASLTTASLGIYFNQNNEREGIEITEIFPNSPLAYGSADVQHGDIILAIDGQEIGLDKEFYTLLEGKSNKKVRLDILKKDGSKKSLSIKPIYPSNDRNMAYQRWVERNESIVDSLSGGKIAYVHVKGMDTGSFQTVYSNLLGKYRNHEAVIVDTRYNFGGWLHNDIAILLGGQKYVTYDPRGRVIGIEPFSQWTKPSIMLVNEANYSDAHATPYAYQKLGLGELLGTPVPGTMTAVWWETQIDPSLVLGIPEVTNSTNDGTPLENYQLNPDILIYNDPNDIENGTDTQLIKAVERLQEKLTSNPDSK